MFSSLLETKHKTISTERMALGGRYKHQGRWRWSLGMVCTQHHGRGKWGSIYSTHFCSVAIAHVASGPEGKLFGSIFRWGSRKWAMEGNGKRRCWYLLCRGCASEYSNQVRKFKYNAQHLQLHVFILKESEASEGTLLFHRNWYWSFLWERWPNFQFKK